MNQYLVFQKKNSTCSLGYTNYTLGEIGKGVQGICLELLVAIISTHLHANFLKFFLFLQVWVFKTSYS